MLEVEVMRAFASAELLFKDIDVSEMSREDIKNALKEQDETFIITVDDNLKEFCGLYNENILRKGCSFDSISAKELKDMKCSADMTLSYDNFIDIIRLLKTIGVDMYASLDEEIFDPNFKDNMAAIEASHDYTKAFKCPLKDLNPLDELKILLALCNYPSDLGQKIYDYASSPQEFKLKDFKDFEVVNNRIIIPLSAVDKYNIKHKLKEKGYTEDLDEVMSMNALVISKNPIDYFYSSYGNAFQSCFALNSSMSCWYGYVPFVMADESYIIYGTTGDVMKTGIIRGNKFHNPNMLWRAWGYADKNGTLLVDKKYRKADRKYDALIEACCKMMSERFNAICDGPHSSSEERKLLNNGKGLYDIWKEYGLKFYADSIRRENKKVTFKYGRGQSEESSYTPEWMRKNNNFINFAGSVTSVGSIDLTKPNVIVDGVLFTPKLCPITGMLIAEDEEKHPLSKYFTKPVTNLAVITYINGTVFTDYLNTTNRISSGKLHICFSQDITRTFNQGELWVGAYNTPGNGSKLISLKTLKELLKGEVKKTGLDAILLRVLENDKVTCQVFRGN